MFPKGAIKACEDIGVFGSDDQIGTPSGGQGEAADTAVGEEFDGFLHSELKMGGRVRRAKKNNVIRHRADLAVECEICGKDLCFGG